MIGTTLLLSLLASPLFFEIGKAWWDAYAPFSGVVVDKGVDWHFLMRGVHYFVVVKDAQGHTFKKHVTSSDHRYLDIGATVVKERGLGQAPRIPGKKTTAELVAEAKRKQAERQAQTR